ncbi:MAG: DUF2461 domain-containing protein [Bacteroidota bacterium]
MITNSYTTFFEALEVNNDREWFKAHLADYEQHVKKPFLALLSELIQTVQCWDHTIPSDPKKALFQLHRDLRFSQDKTPYHTLMKAGFVPGGKKSGRPGFYLGISAHNIHVGGGAFTLKRDSLKAIRLAIAKDPETFINIVSTPAFTAKLGPLKGERSKRIAKMFQQTLAQTDLISLKQFYAMGNLPLKHYYNTPKLQSTIIEYLEATRPLITFLDKAIGTT